MSTTDDHEHVPDWGDAFYIEGAFVLPCCAELDDDGVCTFETEVTPPPTLVWRPAER